MASASTFSPLGANAAMLRSNAADPRAMRRVHQRHGNQCAQQQPPIDPRQNAQAAHELNDRPPGVVQHAEHQLADAAGVLPQDARRAARLELLNAMQRQPHDVREDLLSDRQLQHLGDARGVPAAPHVNAQLDERDRQHRGRNRHQERPRLARQPSGKRGRQRLAAQHVVDDELRRGRRQQGQQRRDRQRRERKRHGGPLPAQQPKKLPTSVHVERSRRCRSCAWPFRARNSVLYW